jgi:hypothetical protein
MRENKPGSQIMSEQSDNSVEPRARDLDYEQARLAYSIIESLLKHTQVVSDLIALMAQVLDEDSTRALTNTPHWKAYLDSRREMERTRQDIERFTEIMTALSDEKENL